MKKHTILLGLLVSTLLLQGCAALVVGGAAGTAKASGDRRTLGAQWDDQTIELKAAQRSQQDQRLQQQWPRPAGRTDTF